MLQKTEDIATPHEKPAGGAVCSPCDISANACAASCWRYSPLVQASLVFALAFVLRIQFLSEIAPHPLLDINLVRGTDMEAYVQWARRIAAGNWLGWGEGPFWQGPAFPYFLGSVFALFGPELFVAQVIQAVLGGLTAAAVYAIGFLLFSPAVGLVAGLLTAAYGMLVFFGVILHSTTLEVFLAAVALLALALANRRGGGWWLWAGVALGLAALARPNFLLATPCVAAGLWIRDWRGNRSALLRVTALFLAGVVLVVLPVTIRNVAIGKQFVILSAAGPETFRITNSYDSTPLNFRYPALPQMPLTSWAFWRHQLLKAGFFWWGFEVPQNVNFYLFQSVSRSLAIPIIAYWMLGPLFAAGLWLARREWRKFLPLWLFGLAYYLSVVAFHIVGRFRLPLVPLFAVFAASAILSGWHLALQRRWGRLGSGAVVVGLLMLACRPWGFPLIYPVDHGNYGYILANRGELAEGLAQLAIAEQGLPGHPNLNYDMGRILLILGRPQEALPRFEREMRVPAANANVYWRAGLTAKRLADRERAVRYLEQYLALAPSGAHAEAVRRELAALRPAPPAY